MPGQNLHDKIFKRCMKSKRAAEAFATDLFPKKISDNLEILTLRLENDSHVSKDLKEHFSDIIYSCESKSGEKVFVNFVFEHKSYLPDRPEVQLLQYIANAYSHQVREQKIEQKIAPLTRVIPVLLYHGKEKWTKKQIDEYTEFPNLVFAEFVPEFDYILVDLSELPDEEIMSIEMDFFLRSLLLLFKHKNDKQYVLENWRKITNFVEYNASAEQLNEDLRTLIFYTVKAFNMTLQQTKELIAFFKEEGETEKSAFELIIEEGEIIGIAKGMEKGIAKGMEKGMEKGLEKGMERATSFTQLIMGIEVVLNCIFELPDLPLKSIKVVTGMDEIFIKKVQQGFANGDKKKAQKIITELFKDFDELNQMETIRIENLYKKHLPKFSEKK